MEEQTPNQEGVATPTPEAGMSTNDSAQTQADPSTEAQPAEEKKPESLKIIEESLGREFRNVEEAQESLRNLNSLVGDQTVSKQRKALEKLAKESNVTTDELIELVESPNFTQPQLNQETTTDTNPVEVDQTLAKVTRIEVDTLTEKVPAAGKIKDAIFAEALQTGKPAREIWDMKYAPIHEAGKESGAKKLQTTLEGQSLRAESADMEQGDTKVDFSGINPQTGKPWTTKEMEEVIGYTAPNRRL